ncbi:uncharacterized protein LOC132976069, partial [Labrus mixtus]|uniref:uncharacterized protein LOC132976069 n=1 Tax=Labrus mixtus TaxID=508554 RepID=UPI0029C0A163
GRKSGGHRKHSDGGYSDTSSAGSFPDETDREVSSLTDRAFRSLCIGDEAVYNDSDLGASSPCTQRDRQLAFSQSAQDRDGEREELKRTAHESFSLRMQQYEQNWIHGGMYGAEIQRDPQWEDYGERTQGRVSATFQQSFVETSQQEAPLRGEQLSFLSNGATEVSSQQRRSRSRVSSLIRAFNSEGQRDGAGMDGKLRELNDDTSWDKSALMSIQRELSEFSTSYQDNFNSGHFSSAGPFSSRDAGFYSSEVAAMSHINSGPSFMRSSHSKHSMSTQVNCNSNFFIHSEFSPFKVWRDHNRFPFQQGEVSGFMRYPDFPKWYETPMYKELSLESQPQVPYRFEERGMRNLRNNWAPVVPPSPPRATSTSTMLHRASAVEKRCDSELAGHYTYRKRAQSLGTNRLQPQRPSTASPTIEMSRRVQDTISSVKALQQKIKMMTEQNISTEMTMHKQGVSYSNDYRIPYGNDAKSVAPNVVSSNTSTTPFNISQLLTPVVHAHQESETSEVRQSAVSPQLVEHPPVRAESRGATPDIRMSSYKSRATSLLFNLKDNRKRVKSTYSPTKFKGLETQDKNKQPLIQEPRDTVIDIPDFPDAEYPQVEESGWTNAVSHNYANQYFSPGSSFATNYEPAAANTGQYSEYTSSDYQTAQMQERAQTKQEILTSKIKAHAEKEISAIKEKGFAKRDGIISKTSTKQLGGNQFINARQKPPSQDAPKKHDSTISSNATLKHHMEPQGTKMVPAKSALPSSSATIPVKSAATTSQSLDQSQKVLKEPMNGDVPKPPTESKLTTRTDNGLVEHQNKENRSPIHSKEQPPKTKQLKQESDLEENSGNKTDGPKDNLILDTVNLIKEKEARPVVEVKSSKAITTEKAESTHEAVLEDSSLNIVFGQIKTPVADDSLQIRGIMVTVRERKPSLSDVEINSPNTPDQINAKESRNSELKEGNLSSDPETSKGNTSLNTKVESKDKVIQGTHPTMIDDKTKVGMKIHPENIQGASTRETKQNNMFETVTLQQESSYADASPQRETQLQEPAREKVSPSNVTVPAKNKTLAETQSLLYNQDIIPGETKDFTNVTPIENRSKSIGTDEVKVNVHEKNPPKSQTTHANDSNVVAKQINQMNDCKRDGAESLIKQNIKPLVKEDMSTVINPSNSRDTDGKSAPLLDEKKHHSTPPKPLSKTSASHNLTDNENRQVENNQVDDSVHIDSIAIRVVSAVTEDNITKGEKHVTAVASDEATANDQVASSSVEGKLKKDNRTKDTIAASSENQFEINLEDNLLVQSVLSSVRKLSDSLKNNNQQESINATSQNVQDETGEHESINASGNSVDESKTHPTEEDYFQVQGTAETNHKPHRKANVADSSDAVSKGRDLPGLQSKKGLFSKESDNERKNEVFMLDQSLRKTAESRSVNIQEENAKRNNGETEDKLASKQSDGPTERPGSKNEKSQVGQAVHIRKQQTESKSTLSLRERQSLRNSNPTRESGGEKPEVKPTPKPRASTIPEISALADYARLKVIVSEDRDDTIQEFPPNKKEGFFPLIQSRHSRRPVFTADPQDFPVKEKTLPNKTEVSSKVNKEPKPLVFPITEKEHQRTGMFKLGDKERQEKLLLDAKANEDTQVKNAQHIQGRIKSPTSHVKKERIEEAPLTDMQRAHQTDERTQSNNPPLQAPASSSALNRPRQRNTSVTQQMKPSDNTNPNEKLQEFSPTAERIPCLDKNPHPKPTLVQGNNMEDSTRTSRKTQKIENAKTDSLEKPTPPHEDTKPKQQNRAKQSEVKHTSRTDDTEDVKIKHIIAESRASLAEEERKAAKREEERRTREREAIANRIKERREKQREADRREEEERKGKHTEGSRAAQKEKMRANQRQEEKLVKEIEEIRELIAEEQQGKHREQQRLASQEVPRRRAASNERQRRAAQEEQQTRAAKEELHRKRAAEEEQKRRAAQEEQQRRAVEVEQQRKAAQEEQQRRDAHEEQQRRAAQKEQERKAALEEEQKRAVQEELKNRAAQEEQQRRAAQKEQERKAALEEEQKRAAQQEQQMRAAHEEQQRRAFQEGQQRKRAAEEEKQRIVAQKEQERIAALEEQQKRAALEAQQTRAALEEQQRRAAQEEQQRIAALEEQQRRAAQEEQQRIAALEEQQRRTAHEEQQRIAALEEQQRRAAHEEQQRMAALEEQQRRAAHEEQQWRASLIEEQRLARQTEEKILTDIEERKKINQRDQEQPADISEQKRFNLIQEQRKTEQHTEEQREGRQKKEERARVLEKSQAAPNDEKRGAQERMLDQKEGRERDKAAQRMEALQYYAITSTDSERKPKERQIYSPLPPQQKNNPVGPESSEDSGSHSRSYRPHAPASPAPSLPRSNTSSPALGAKPSMFRVKDNSFRGSSFTKSVKPRFHKSFGEDYRVGSPMERERREDEQDILRWSAGTPVHPDRLAAIRELSSFPPTSSSQDYSVPLPQHRPYSRRSIALDEDDSRSVVSNMSEGVESFATSAADLSDIRSSYYDERPESACSFSSDVSRSMGKPPTVPPKSEKALRRAKRLTSRRINKEKPKAGADGPAGVEKPLQDVSGIPSSSSTEVCSSNRHAVASPHFTPPLSLALAPALGSSLPSSSTEHQSSHSSFHASPHATAPVSLPVASPHATAPVSLPIVSTHATGPASHTAAPKTVAHIPSSPTLHHANRPATVTQYHVESSYPQSYPLTQRKVLQDLGSGQYFVVDVPVQVKTKTFIDPETGKYVQLNVRESAQSNPRPQPKLQPQPQQTYLQPQLQPQMQVKPQQQQQQPLSQPSPAGKPAVFYEGYQGYQPAANKFVPHNRSSAPGTPYQDQQPVREGRIYGYQAPEIIANSEGPRYSPEKTPYMDTVNDSGKTHNTVYNTHGPYESFPECDTNSQLAGSQVRENDNSAHSRYQPQEIIAISELEDFMEVSDW